MPAVVRPHFRAGGCPQQREFQAVSIHGNSVLTVIEHRRAVSAVTQRTVAVVAYLEPILVVRSGSVRGTLHVAKLHFVDAVFRMDIHRERYFEQAVQFLPVRLRLEHQPAGFLRQTDVLPVRGCPDPARHQKHRFHTLSQLFHFDVKSSRNLLLPVIGINVPGIKKPWHVFVHMETVHGLCRKLPAAFFQDEGRHFPAVIYHRSHLSVFQNKAILCTQDHRFFRRPVSRLSSRLIRRCRPQGNPAAGRQFHQRLKPLEGMLHRQNGSVRQTGSPCKGIRQRHQRFSGKTQGIEDRNRLFFPALIQNRTQRLFPYPACLLQKLLHGFSCFHIHPGDGRPRKNIVELVQQQRLPKPVRLLQRILPAFRFRQTGPHFHLPQRQLALPVLLLDHRLRRIRASVGGEVQFAGIGVFRPARLFHIGKELQRSRQLHPRAAFQIFLPARIFHVISGRSAAAVSVPVRQQKSIQIPKLPSVLPDRIDLLRIRLVGVAGGQEGNNLRAVHPLPGKVVIRELVSLIVGPEDLLRYQIFDAASFQNLRQSCRIAEGVRQPEDNAVHAQHFPVIPFAMN